MNVNTLATTIVAGVLGMVMLICTTILLVSGVAVPDEFIPALLLLIGVATGASTKVTQ